MVLSVSVIELAYLYQTDWNDAAAQAAERLRSEDITVEAKLTPVDTRK
jgi:MATE family multidrug resistance protein